MNAQLRQVLAAVGLLCYATLHTSAVVYTPVDNSSYANKSIFDGDSLFINPATYPSGDLTLGGVPFENVFQRGAFWSAHFAPGVNPRVLEVSVSVFGATEVHSLMNTYWGQFGPSSYAAVEFVGSDGAFYHQDLIGGVDLRDYNQNPSYPNTINGTTTTEVFNNSIGQRLDKQFFDLPASFADETLTTIRFIDNGAADVQRIFVAGITVGATQGVPDGGATLALMGVAVGALITLRRRIR